MIVEILISLAIDVLEAAIAIPAVLLILRYFDKVTGKDFKWRLEVMEDNGTSAIYFGLRILAICILAAFIFS